jgi:hypothetical protein
MISINFWQDCYGGEWHTGQDSGGMSPYPITWEPTHWRPMTEEERKPYLTYLAYD